MPLNRRTFLSNSAKIAALSMSTAPIHSCISPPVRAQKKDFEISLAQWSLHKSLRARLINNLDFAAFANKLDIKAIEYVNQFFHDKALNKEYIDEMKRRADDLGVRSLLIMCDGLGDLGNPSSTQRNIAVQNHRPWLRAAKQLGCHSIRVNAHSKGSYEEQQKLAADGLKALAVYAQEYGLNVIVENHGGYSSNSNWLAHVIKRVGMENCGTLPDFGNFYMKAPQDDWFDRYQGLEELMPYAKAISAKSHAFDSNGEEIYTDYTRMMTLVLRSGYSGHIGIEYEGTQHSEKEGIILTRDLLLRLKEELPPLTPLEPWENLFNGEDLSNWRKVNCHEDTFTVVDNMIKCDGIPTGVLRSEKRYRNFICEFEFKHMKDISNAGFFIWSDPTPALGVPFTRSIEVQVINGYETENYTSHGDIFAIWGATLKPVRPHPSGWERCLPSERRARGTGEWNHFRITAIDGQLSLSVNGKVVSAGTEINPKEGYLCIESEGTPVFFRNMRIRNLPAKGRLNEHERALPAKKDICLYNGRDLSGWETSSVNHGWVPQDSVLTADTGASPLKYKIDQSVKSISIDWTEEGKPWQRIRIKRGEEKEIFSFLNNSLMLHPTRKTKFTNLFSRS